MEKNGKKRHRWMVLGLMGLLALLAGHWLPGAILRYDALHDERPSVTAMEAVCADNPLAGVKALWNTRLLPQRIFAINKLRELWFADESLRPRLRPILIEALDCGIQKAEMGAIRLLGYSDITDSDRIIAELNSGDPVIRRLVLEILIRNGSGEHSAQVAPLLDDADRSVRIFAATALRRWTGNDFGVRWKGASEAEIEKGLTDWRRWRDDGNVAIANMEQMDKPSAPSYCQAVDFELPDADGGIFRLSELGAQPKMLYFWGACGDGCSGKCDADMTLVREVVDNFSDKLAVVPIAVDAVPKIHVGHQHEADDGHGAHHDKRQDIRQDIIREWRDGGCSGLCLIDDGAASFRYNSNEMPTVVLIRDGMIVRHLSGKRSLDALNAIVDDALTN